MSFAKLIIQLLFFQNSPFKMYELCKTHPINFFFVKTPRIFILFYFNSSLKNIITFKILLLFHSNNFQLAKKSPIVPTHIFATLDRLIIIFHFLSLLYVNRILFYFRFIVFDTFVCSVNNEKI